ncbi:ARM repeats containing protein [Babesia ovata]|uniref:ARM repeats containing protein n=1 Tax=Babesia ovata TaxID=189622 RepID=A0A2H6KE66_9APIC|nr:ARM repeats containing protein [Babesia ovata]GBE61277.1 ARM repeats containing protein [Babesia ovata]
MGNSCCLGRLHEYRTKLSEIESQVIDNIASYGPISDVLGLDESECDIERFDLAFENGDINEFVALCESTQPIDKLEDRLHPWAANPTTIGALAATQLAIFASKEQQPEFKDAIREASGIPILVEMLRSNEVDRVHVAVVALSFMSAGNTENCVEMFRAGALTEMIRGMKSDIDGMRAACAQTCRNIYQLDLEYRRVFVKQGGLVNLVNLLSPCDDRDEEMCLTQLEAIYHIEDFIMDGVEELPEFVSIVKVSGAREKLKLLEKVLDILKVLALHVDPAVVRGVVLPDLFEEGQHFLALFLGETFPRIIDESANFNVFEDLVDDDVRAVNGAPGEILYQPLRFIDAEELWDADANEGGKVRVPHLIVRCVDHGPDCFNLIEELLL